MAAAGVYANSANLPLSIIEGIHVLIAGIQGRVQSDDGERIGSNAGLQRNGVDIFLIVANQGVALLLLQEFIERSLIGDQSALIHLDGNAPEQREVVFHLRVLNGIAGAALGLGRINHLRRAAVGIRANVQVVLPPFRLEGLLNQGSVGGVDSIVGGV